ncbi:MAG: multidrug efflux MFS transporter [Chloroflexi bacterium]|nr:multidrug efflux MFS transporter [Chloroflexota bacterium]
MLLAGFVRRELRTDAPMLELRLFRNAVFSMAVLARLSGFIAMTVSRFLMPIYLISLRGLEEAAAGGVLFLTSLGMGIAAQGSGRLADRFGPRPFAVAGFAVSLLATLPMAFLGTGSSLVVVMLLLFGVGLGMGLWTVPNNSIIMGSVSPSRMGVVSALTNLTRNVGNVTGQALAASVVAAVMAAGGFDIPLSEIADSPGAARSFIAGWRWAYALAAAFSIAALALAFRTRSAFDLARW